MRGSKVRKVRHWVANRGWLGLLREVVRQARSKLVSKLASGTSAGGMETAVDSGNLRDGGDRVLHPFDERHGVETGGVIWGEELRSGAKAEYWATAYYGTSPSVFWQAMERLELEWGRYTFVDVGCGKGRVLMLALKYPFRRVLGLELSAELAGVANENLRRFRAEWRREAPAEAVAGDATVFDMPDGPLVVYLYHPFAAPVMMRFLYRLRASVRREPREIYLLYMNPELDRLLLAQPFLERMWRDCFAMLEEDAAADRFGLREEYVSAYRVLTDR